MILRNKSPSSNHELPHHFRVVMFAILALCLSANVPSAEALSTNPLTTLSPALAPMAPNNLVRSVRQMTGFDNSNFPTDSLAVFESMRDAVIGDNEPTLSVISRQRLGSFIAITIVILLASTTTDLTEISRLIAREGVWDGYIAESVSQLKGVVVPGGASDIVSIGLGEVLGGLTGSAAVAGVNLFFGSTGQSNNGKVMPSLSLATRVIADSDFFIARSASRSLLQSAGIPASLSNLFSSLFAVIPSQLVKINYQRKQSMKLENEIMNDLLTREISAQKKRPLFDQLGSLWTTKPKKKGEALAAIVSTANSNSNSKSLKPVTAFQFDVVDIFADIVKWLEYDVLMTDLAHSMPWYYNPLGPAISGLVFGGIAGLSSMMYADLLYGTFKLGPDLKQLEVRTRQPRGWAALYASGSITSASIFGVYEATKLPASRWVQGILAGGFDGCLGSQEFDACLQSYIDTNAPGPSLEAQIRALVINLSMVEQRLLDIYADAGSPEEVWGQIQTLAEMFSHNQL